MMLDTVYVPIQYKIVCMRFEAEEITAHFIFPTTKGSMSACVEHVKLSTSNGVKHH